jgi:hypothetical protein
MNRAMILDEKPLKLTDSAGSLALIADTGHMLIDAAALALSTAMWMAQRPATSEKSYGLTASRSLPPRCVGAARPPAGRATSRQCGSIQPCDRNVKFCSSP